MFKTLDFFNFGPSFKRWIRTLYTLPVAKVKNNGHLSENFQYKEVFDKDALSRLCYLFCQ